MKFKILSITQAKWGNDLIVVSGVDDPATLVLINNKPYSDDNSTTKPALPEKYKVGSIVELSMDQILKADYDKNSNFKLINLNS